MQASLYSANHHQAKPEKEMHSQYASNQMNQSLIVVDPDRKRAGNAKPSTLIFRVEEFNCSNISDYHHESRSYKLARTT